MTCNPCETPLGRVIVGRSTPGYDVRIKGEPLTDYERQQRHYATYGTTTLPLRGTGLARAGTQRLGPDLGTFVVGAIVGFIFAAFVITAPGREIGAAAARRAAKRIGRK